jgi:uncharacterized small protein (DUF1192 family)
MAVAWIANILAHKRILSIDEIETAAILTDEIVRLRRQRVNRPSRCAATSARNLAR